MVPAVVEKSELLAVLEVAWGGRGAQRTAAQRRVPDLVNRPGAANLLLDSLRNGETFEAQTAAFGLLYARSELVRRQLKTLARELPGERRLACLSAMTPEEVSAHVAQFGDSMRSQLIASSVILAMNSPAEFIEVVCEGGPGINLDIVDEIEALRRRYGIGATALYEPLLQRPLTQPAFERVIAILGVEPAADVHRLLRRALTRARDEGVRRMLRREQLRNASQAIVGPAAQRRDGVAFLTPLGADGRVTLDIFERVRDGQPVRLTLTWVLRGTPEFVSVPISGQFDAHIAREIDPDRDARMTLGQARTILESLQETHRAVCAPVLSRLADVPPESVPIPAPGNCFTEEVATELAASPLWADWCPFAAVAREGLRDEMQLVSAQLQRRTGAALLADGFRHMAFLLQLRANAGLDEGEGTGDITAASLVAEAIWIARRRISPFVRALARRGARA